MDPSPQRLHQTRSRAAALCLAGLLLGSGITWLALSEETGVPSSDRARAAADRVRPALETALEDQGLALGDPVFLRIFKEENELEAWVRDEADEEGRFQLFRTWEICTWSGKLGPKEQQGDGQAPEGFYYVPPAAMNPHSSYHLSFNLGYPNAYDRHHGRTGDYLMVHGNCVSVGCYAMTDPRIEEIYTLLSAALKNGQPFVRVHCFPFRMTEERMQAAASSEWIAFWENLKEGYDYFEDQRTPPDVTVSTDGKYQFE